MVELFKVLLSTLGEKEKHQCKAILRPVNCQNFPGCQVLLAAEARLEINSGRNDTIYFPHAAFFQGYPALAAFLLLQGLLYVT
jgi:hypothetical protein